MSSHLPQNQRIQISLTEQERQLLIHECRAMSKPMTARLVFTQRHGDEYEYRFTIEELAEILEALAAETRHTRRGKKLRLIQDVVNKLSDPIDMLCPEAEPPDEAPLPPDKAELIQFIENLLEKEPALTYDQINTHLAEYSARKNQTPRKEFHGLSSEDVARLIYIPWGAQGSPIHFNQNLFPNDVNGAEIMENARLFLDKALHENGVRATVAGNLNRKFVQAMLVDMVWPYGYMDNYPLYKNTWNEEEIPRLHILRLILTFAGLIRKYRSRFLVTKKGHTLLNEANAGAMYGALFFAMFQKLNLAYLYAHSELPEIQATLAYSLKMIQQFANDWTDTRALASKLFLPVIAGEILTDSLLGDPATFFAEFRILRPLARFGLVELKFEEKATPRSCLRSSAVRKTPLYDTFIHFDFS